MKDNKVDPEAKKKYEAEIKSIDEKLSIAIMNHPKEREAQRRANVIVENKKNAAKEAGTPLTKAEIKKASQQAINNTRKEVSTVSRRKRNIPITDSEWEAINSNAITSTKINQLLNNTDEKEIRARATPRSSVNVTPAKVSRIKAMQASNYTVAEIARATGLSTSTITKYLKGE